MFCGACFGLCETRDWVEITPATMAAKLPAVKLDAEWVMDGWDWSAARG